MKGKIILTVLFLVALMPVVSAEYTLQEFEDQTVEVGDSLEFDLLDHFNYSKSIMGYELSEEEGYFAYITSTDMLIINATQEGEWGFWITAEFGDGNNVTEEMEIEVTNDFNETDVNETDVNETGVNETDVNETGVNETEVGRMSELLVRDLEDISLYLNESFEYNLLNYVNYSYGIPAYTISESDGYEAYVEDEILYIEPLELGNWTLTLTAEIENITEEWSFNVNIVEDIVEDVSTPGFFENVRSGFQNITGAVVASFDEGRDYWVTGVIVLLVIMLLALFTSRNVAYLSWRAERLHTKADRSYYAGKEDKANRLKEKAKKYERNAWRKR